MALRFRDVICVNLRYLRFLRAMALCLRASVVKGYDLAASSIRLRPKGYAVTSPASSYPPK